MNHEVFADALSLASSQIEAPPLDWAELNFPSFVAQKYRGETTRFGARSTCQVAAVINASRLFDPAVSDFQDQLVADARVPWDTRIGGIPTDYEVLVQMTSIYQEYSPNVSIQVPTNRMLSHVLQDLRDGTVYTVSTGRNHSVTLFGLYASENDGGLSSILVNPLSAQPKAISWNILLARELQTTYFEDVIVQTVFAISG